MELLLLFWEFFKVGLFAIGGGLATLPFLKELTGFGWYNLDQLSNMFALSSSLPGAIGVNLSSFIGYQVYGIIGQVVAVLGLVSPSVIVIVIIAKMLDKFKNAKFIGKMFYAIRPVVVGYLVVVCMNVFKSAFIINNTYTLNYLVVILFSILYFIAIKYKAHPILILLLSAVWGILLKL